MKTIFTATLDLPYNEAITKIRDCLAERGFGIITEINVKSTFKKKLDLDFKNYTILGACNPKFAHEALSLNDNVGLLLPCNVIVYEDDNGVTVSTMKPTHMLNILGDKTLSEVGERAESLLEKAFNCLNS